ncbi:MAG: hypothetical protein UX31_C0010G0026 [Candidatus Nomurabacteria bacterium GW2011_GWA1_46_11]|uniref:DoxX family protein n=1 Tax=Candidatus Nomurabacteria bacterium GW2011_GWA1_46_11 TaxID=1618732 RepID=A0A0G1RLT9_9BACT|nr:MAG: hypothetical protein UX29_C0008G0012 [Parcubacteria group bacterium GW2011_GWA2_46_10]KKU21895.1 MAG: hypothetical protein UX31_C0010G0026 [Candidatus Nomurabacteria bacterium GW2011_GWA1_46_11]
MYKIVEILKRYEMWLLRVAVAFPMLWAGIGGIREPSNWIGYVPDFVEVFFDKGTFLVIHSSSLILFAVFLMTGPLRRFFSLLAFLNLLSILIFFGLDDITFRDLGLVLVALVLTVREFEASHLSSVG